MKFFMGTVVGVVLVLCSLIAYSMFETRWKQETLRQCVAAGRPPLECRAAAQ